MDKKTALNLNVYNESFGIKKTLAKIREGLPEEVVFDVISNKDGRIFAAIVDALKKENANGGKIYSNYGFNDYEIPINFKGLLAARTRMAKIEAGLDPRWSQLEKTCYFFMQISKYLSYNDLQFNKNFNPKGRKRALLQSRNLYTCLATGRATCLGAILVFKALCDKHGIPCELKQELREEKMKKLSGAVHYDAIVETKDGKYFVNLAHALIMNKMNNVAVYRNFELVMPDGTRETRPYKIGQVLKKVAPFDDIDKVFNIDDNGSVFQALDRIRLVLKKEGVEYSPTDLMRVLMRCFHPDADRRKSPNLPKLYEKMEKQKSWTFTKLPDFAGNEVIFVTTSDNEVCRYRSGDIGVQKVSIETMFEEIESKNLTLLGGSKDFDKFKAQYTGQVWKEKRLNKEI